MLVGRWGAGAPGWPGQSRLGQAAGRALPRINVSVKLSALDPYLDPIDPDGSARAVKARLRPIWEAARAHGAHIQGDIEERQLTDLTLRIFAELADVDALRASRDLGVLQQSYLKDAEADAPR